MEQRKFGTRAVRSRHGGGEQCQRKEGEIEGGNAQTPGRHRLGHFGAVARNLRQNAGALVCSSFIHGHERAIRTTTVAPTPQRRRVAALASRTAISSSSKLPNVARIAPGRASP